LIVTIETLFLGGNHPRPLTVIRSPRARHMRLAVDPRDGSVRLTLPRRAGLADALRWAETKRGWIDAQLVRLPEPRPVVNHMRFDFAGQPVEIDWSDHHPRTPQILDDRLRVGGPEAQLGPRLLRWLKQQARDCLTRETLEMAGKIGVSIAAVRIGDPVSRWGSCASSGRISYSWRLILAPSFVRRATVAHEVAHRIHMNHGPAFHALVAQLLETDPAPARAWLRQNGASLHWFGRSS
jgi:predicted metal-dependent hydrolase